jgi:hypothetical protein
MDLNSCGNCTQFNPESDQKHFNCTKARKAGLNYSMQVRADTPACDAFAPAKAPLRTATAQLQERAEPRRANRRLKIVLLAAFFIVFIILLSSLLYTCVYRPMGTGSNSPVNTPTPSPTQTSVPTATPAPPYNIQYFSLGSDQWAISPDREATVCCARRVSSYQLLTGRIVSAPPGTVFIFITATVMNTGSSALPTTANDFVLSDAQGHAYPNQLQEPSYYVGHPYVDRYLYSGEIASGDIIWVVPNVASGGEISYLLNHASAPPVIARWKLPW